MSERGQVSWGYLFRSFVAAVAGIAALAFAVAHNDHQALLALIVCVVNTAAEVFS